MKTASVDLLNKAIKGELSAIHQYMYFHFHCDDQGLHLLANLFKRTAVAEMVHLDKLAERVLFLNGDVEMSPLGELKKVKEPKEMLELSAMMERESTGEYNQWANDCWANADAISKQLFETLVADEERHYDVFSKQLANIEKFGVSYLALQSMEPLQSNAEH